MSALFPTLLISRRPRQAGIDWTRARSWLGGAPRMDAASWPRDDKLQPLPFVAQIDLAEVAAISGKTPLPDKGSLAFFTGREGAVVFVPQGQSNMSVMPLSGAPDLIEYGGSPDWRTDLAGRPLFPYWPVNFTVLDVPPPPPDEDEDAYQAFLGAQVAAVEQLFPRRKYFLSAREAFAGPPIPDWWRTAIHYAGYLDKAVREIPKLIVSEQEFLARLRKTAEEAQSKSPNELKTAQDSVARCERKIAKLHELQPAFLEFAAAVSDFSKRRDPWALMNPDETAQLASLWARNAEFGAFHFNQGTFPLDYLKDQMFKALPAAGTPEFSAFPTAVRNLIDEKRAPRPQWWFKAIHYAKRLQDAAQLGVPGALKWREEQIVSLRKLHHEWQPNDALAIFRRMLGPKSEKVTKLEADIVKSAARLAELHRLEPAFKTFVREVNEWTKGRDPWMRMLPADIAQLDVQMKRMQDEFKDFDAYVPRPEELETSTLLAMATADERGYAALPEPVRTLINRDCLLPSGGWHQMFGRGIEIQGDSVAMREEGYIMLLQLTYDDMMHWGFGDNGCYQFWISPADLAQQNWAAAKMMFECG